MRLAYARSNLKRFINVNIVCAYLVEDYVTIEHNCKYHADEFKKTLIRRQGFLQNEESSAIVSGWNI